MILDFKKDWYYTIKPFCDVGAVTKDEYNQKISQSHRGKTNMHVGEDFHCSQGT